MNLPVDNASLYRTSDGYHRVVAHYDSTFDRLGISFEFRYVQTSYGPTHVVMSGSPRGKTLVLWHGLNANATSWASWLPALVPKYRIYAIDTVGGLGKSAPSRPASRGPAYGIWAAEVLAGLGLERANMLGASNGGWLILKLAAVEPQRIGSAVLMSAAGLGRLSAIAAVRTVPRVLFKPPSQAARGLLELLSPPDQQLDPFFLGFFELILSSGFRSEPMAPRLGDDDIGHLVAPTYLLLGQYERSFDPYRAIRRSLRLLPGLVAAEIVPGVGHAMVHAQPDWVTGRVLGFLDKYAI
jgi:pimeloyl-ACP methyl ester carboxylesterase